MPRASTKKHSNTTVSRMNEPRVVSPQPSIPREIQDITEADDEKIAEEILREAAINSLNLVFVKEVDQRPAIEEPLKKRATFENHEEFMASNAASMTLWWKISSTIKIPGELRRSTGMTRKIRRSPRSTRNFPMKFGGHTSMPTEGSSGRYDATRPNS